MEFSIIIIFLMKLNKIVYSDFGTDCEQVKGICIFLPLTTVVVAEL